MGKNWITTLGGLITAVGASLITQEDSTLRVIGQVCSIVGPLILGWAAKQYNVTGGSVPQASPPGVAIISDAMGVKNAVDAIKDPTYSEVKAKIAAETIISADPVAPTDVTLCK